MDRTGGLERLRPQCIHIAALFLGLSLPGVFGMRVRDKCTQGHNSIRVVWGEWPRYHCTFVIELTADGSRHVRWTVVRVIVECLRAKTIPV